MTGTADTEAEEFAKIYNLDVIVVPTNRRCARIEEPDIVYRTETEKYDAIVNDIVEKQESGRPTLVGTVSIEKSERLSSMLKRRGIKHVVLNAKYHAQEAEIVAQAGPQGARHDRHQHGRPRHRHPARRQPRVHGAPADARRADRRAAAEGRRRSSSTTTSSSTSSTSTASTACRAQDYERIFDALQGADRRRARRSRRRSAACTSSAPSATRRGASTTSCAAAPAARATRVRRASTSRSKTT